LRTFALGICGFHLQKVDSGQLLKEKAAFASKAKTAQKYSVFGCILGRIYGFRHLLSLNTTGIISPGTGFVKQNLFRIDIFLIACSD
jgi:hypothetical protein